MKLSVIIPFNNEIQTIAALIERVLAVPIEKEVILVNDASTDGSAEIANKFISASVKVIHHPEKKGKGAAVRTGLDAVSGDVIVIQDADLEYDPSDFVRLIEPIKKGDADVVYGVRTLESQKMIMRLGNFFVTWVANKLYNRQLQDIETCYKMMRYDLAVKLELESQGFDLEAEITAKLLRLGYGIHELPISYRAREANKKLSPLDGIPTLLALLKYLRWKSGA